MTSGMIEEFIIITICIIFLFINPFYGLAIFWATMSIIIGHSYMDGCRRKNLEYSVITLIEVMFTAPVTFMMIAVTNAKQDLGLTDEDQTLFDIVVEEDEEDTNDDSKTGEC